MHLNGPLWGCALPQRPIQVHAPAQQKPRRTHNGPLRAPQSAVVSVVWVSECGMETRATGRRLQQVQQGFDEILQCDMATSRLAS
jgi:hypothetical protein